MNFADFLAQRGSQPATKVQAPKPKASSSHPRFPAFAPFLKWLQSEWPGGNFRLRVSDGSERGGFAWSVELDGDPFMTIRAPRDGWDEWDAIHAKSGKRIRWASLAPPTLKALKQFIVPAVRSMPRQYKKLTSPILGVASSDVTFTTLDEWHDTSVTLVLNLRSDVLVPKAEVLEWVKDNWLTIRKALPEPFVPEEEGEYGEDRPLPGLGWRDPKRMAFGEFEESSIRQQGNRITLHLTASTRDY